MRIVDNYHSHLCQAAAKHATQLFTGSLRRCRGHDRHENGFVELRTHVTEAQDRIKTVQKQVPRPGGQAAHTRWCSDA